MPANNVAVTPQAAPRLRVFPVLACLALGLLLGVVAKYSDTIPANGYLGSFWSVVRDATTRLGIWVFLGATLAAWSRNPWMAAVKVFALFAGMLAAYYTYSMHLFGHFPLNVFVHWGAIALASPFAAYIAWFGRGDGWGTAICAALPIGLLATEGLPLLYTVSRGVDLALALDMVLAVALFVIMPADRKRWQQWLRILVIAAGLVFVLRSTRALGILLGGF